MIKKIRIIFFCALLAACSGRYIPEKILVEILYEMHLTDAIVITKGLSDIDSVKIYEPVAAKYGYRLNDINRTLMHYAMQNNKLPEIYAKVKTKIENEQLIYKPLARIEKLSKNLNPLVDSLIIATSVRIKRPFDLILDEQGVYDISANYCFFADDSTKNPRISVWLESTTRDSIQYQEISLEKDTLVKEYAFRITFKDAKYNRLKGFWLNFDEDPPKKPEVKDEKKTPPTRNRKFKPLSPAGKKSLQHLKINRMLIKYNFVESDTTRIIFPQPDTVFIKDSVFNKDTKIENEKM
ncbi:MAG: DUF4296 domain-containing protein [Prevotellaceae bacterium]|jgi:hypothetical protein|nr:DUF4296 domain-containing protein [Prevotellaceae bacterium]